MADNNNKEKLETGDLSLFSRKKDEKKHSKVYLWFDNFWYHHKWKTLGILFLTIIVVVCTLQMCSEEQTSDVDVLLAGPYGFTERETEFTSLKSCLATYLFEDFDGDGKKSVSASTFSVYSEEEAEASGLLENTTFRAKNASEYKSFYTYYQTGNATVLILSEYLFEELSLKPDYLLKLDENLSQIPSGAISSKDGHCYGILLKETNLYKENSVIRDIFPEDTVLCFSAMLVVTDKDKYDHAFDYFEELVK